MGEILDGLIWLVVARHKEFRSELRMPGFHI